MADELITQSSESSPAVEEIRDDNAPTIIAEQSKVEQPEQSQLQKPTQIKAGDLPYDKLYCKNGHILGQIVKIKKGNYHLTRLAFWGVNIPPDAILPIELAEHMIHGFMDGGSVYCSFPNCGAERDWFPGEDYIERLKATLKARRDGA